MAYTGVDLYNDLGVRTNQGQSGAFLNIDRANYVINSALVNIFEDVYRQIAIQKNTDEISPCIKRDVPFTPNNGIVLLKPLIIATAEIQANPNITFNRAHNLIAGTPIVITGVTGLSGTITTYTIVDAFTINIVGYTSSGTYVANSGYATSSGYIIDDYYHLLAVQYQSKVNLGLSILGKVTNSNLTILTIPSNNNIRTGEYLYMTGNIFDEDVYVYVEKVAYNKIKLYLDAELKSPIKNANPNWYLSDWNIYRTYSRYADPLNPDQKVDVYKSNFYYPLYQSSDNNISISVYDKHNRIDAFVEPKSFVVDYVRTFPQIDLEDNVYDIHQDFNAKFCDRLIEYSALKFQAFTSATEDAQLTEIIGGTK
jgi:hypothetical protein